MKREIRYQRRLWSHIYSKAVFFILLHEQQTSALFNIHHGYEKKLVEAFV